MRWEDGVVSASRWLQPAAIAGGGRRAALPPKEVQLEGGRKTVSKVRQSPH